MKVFLSLCAIIVVAALVGAEDVLKEEDAEAIQDEQKFKAFYACVIDQEPCPDKLKALKEAVSRYIKTNCADCSPKEKDMFYRFNKMIFEKYPKEHKGLINKFGPKAR